MEKANLYKIIAKFKDGSNWDLKIVAVNASWCTMYINSDNGKNVLLFNVKLLQENYAIVDNKFGSSDWTQELEDNQKRWKTIKR